MDPIGLCFAESVRGINIFRFSKRPPESEDFESVKFSNTIKWKEYQMDPIGFCFRRVHSGETFSTFQKSRLKVGILKVLKPFLKHNKIERISKGPHWVQLSQSPDKTCTLFKKFENCFLTSDFACGAYFRRVRNALIAKLPEQTSITPAFGFIKNQTLGASETEHFLQR